MCCVVLSQTPIIPSTAIAEFCPTYGASHMIAISVLVNPSFAAWTLNGGVSDKAERCLIRGTSTGQDKGFLLCASERWMMRLFAMEARVMVAIQTCKEKRRGCKRLTYIIQWRHAPLEPPGPRTSYPESQVGLLHIRKFGLCSIPLFRRTL